MALIICGINYHAAPRSLREKLYFAPDNMQAPLLDLVQRGHASEAVILSTCNRTELYCSTEQNNHLIHWLLEQHQLQAAELTPYLYTYQDQAAIRHLLRVACGLASMVLGEPQILGQLKKAFSLANLTGTLGGYLQRLFEQIFAIAKRIRSQTAINRYPISVAYGAVVLAKQIFSDISQNSVLLIGAGETIELVTRHLVSQGVNRLFFCNRSLERAKTLAQQFNGYAIPLTELNQYLSAADIIISATASTTPIVLKEPVASALSTRKRRPILMIDLAVPPDIESTVSDLEDVYFYQLEDLQKLLTQNLSQREFAAQQAEQIIIEEAEHIMGSLRELEAADTIRSYREQIEQLRDAELHKALRQLQQGANPDQVLQTLARQLSNKIMHTPCKQLRQAAYTGQHDMLALAKQLFNLDKP